MLGIIKLFPIDMPTTHGVQFLIFQLLQNVLFVKRICMLIDGHFHELKSPISRRKMKSEIRSKCKNNADIAK